MASRGLPNSLRSELESAQHAISCLLSALTLNGAAIVQCWTGLSPGGSCLLPTTSLLVSLNCLIVRTERDTALKSTLQLLPLSPPKTHPETTVSSAYTQP